MAVYHWLHFMEVDDSLHICRYYEGTYHNTSTAVCVVRTGGEHTELTEKKEKSEPVGIFGI